MNGKIALEEHFAVRETLGESQKYALGGAWQDLQARLLDLHDRRLSEMDKHGIEFVIISLNSPGIQVIHEPRRAVETARIANDALAQAIAKHSDRFAGFAALPMQDPEAAIVELHRCVKDLGLKGPMINGFSQIGSPETVVYLDDPRYLSFWAALQQLDVPLYLHPREPLLSREPIYDGHAWLTGPVWAFGVETATHALRLMGSGLFDKYPRVTVILGHLGEGLPASIWRVDHRLSKLPTGVAAKRTMSEYLRDNFYLTTSGNFRTPTFVEVMMEVGADRLLFSVDYPFEETAEAAEWFDRLEISEHDRVKIGRTNALHLFKLGKMDAKRHGS
jgi:gamma-resorcylate decarboxylase